MYFGKKTTFTFGPNHKIKDVLPHQKHTDISINTKEDLEQIVDEPCLKACTDLFEKNIETVDSGCNGVDSSNIAYIVIKYDTLDETNKKIADTLVDNVSVFFEKRNPLSMRSLYSKIRIVMPTTPEETIFMVEKKLAAITQKFKKQERIEQQIDFSELITTQQKTYE